MPEKVGLEAFLKVDDFARGLKSYTTGVERIIAVTGHAAQTVQFIGGVVDKVFSFVGNILANFARGLIGVGQGAIESAMSFDSAFTSVLKTTEGLEDANGNLTAIGEQVRQGLRDMAMEIPADVDALAELAGVAGQLGIQEENLINFTRTIADLGETTNIAGEEGAVQLAQLMNVMGTSQDLVDELGSTIVALGNNFATTEQDVLNFAQRIAGAGEIAGLTETDVLAISAAFTSVGIEAEAGGTAVQKVLFAMSEAARGSTGEMIDNGEAIETASAKLETLEEKLYLAQLRQGEFTEKTKESVKESNRITIENLTEQIEAQKAALAGLVSEHGNIGPANAALQTFAETAGVTVSDFVDLWQTDASGAFQLFVEGLGRAGDDAVGILDELELKDSRLVRAFLSLSQATGVADDSISLIAETLATAGIAWDENTALANEAEKRYRTVESQLAITKNILKDMGITLGDALLPFVSEFLTIGQDLMSEWGEKLPGLLERNVIPVIENLFQVFKDTISGFKSGGIVGGLQGLFTGIGIDTGTQGAIFATVDKVIDFVKWVGSVAPQAIATASKWITGSLIPGIVGVGNWIKGSMIPAIQQVVGWIQQNLVPIVQVIASWFQQYLPTAIDYLATWWTSVLAPAMASIAEQWNTNILPALQGLWAWLQERVPQAISFVSEMWQNVFKPALQAVGAFISEILIPILGQVVGWLIENIPVAIDAASTFWTETLKPAIETVWTFITESLIPTFQNVATWLQETLATAIDVASTFWTETLKPAIETVWTFITESLIPTFQNVATWLQETLATAIGVASTLWTETLKPAIEGVWSFITEYIMPLFAAIVEVFEVTWQKAFEVASGLWTEMLRPAIEDTWAFIVESLQPVLDALAEFWTETLQPALEDVWEFITESLLPVFEDIWKFISESVLPVLGDLSTALGTTLLEKMQAVHKFITESLQKAFEGIKTVIGDVTEFLKGLAEKIASLTLPAWMTPGSPTPWELGLRGVADALHEIAVQELPTFRTQLEAVVSAGAASSMATSMPSPSITTIDRSVSVSAPISATIQNGMDLAMLRSFILDTVSEAVGQS